MLLSILPDTIPVPLGDVGYPSLTAIVRPLDAEEYAQYLATHGEAWNKGPAMVALSKARLRAITGMTAVELEDGTRQPFDLANADHLRAVPLEIHYEVWKALTQRTTLHEAQVGKSDAPSDSSMTPPSAPSPAGHARLPVAPI